MIRLRRSTLAILVVLFVVLPVTEIFLLVQLGQVIGLLPVLALVIVEALVGSWLIRRRWRTALEAVQGRTGSGVLTGQTGGIADASDTAVFVAGGVALIFPGLITDLIALICLLPYTRKFPRMLLDRAVQRRIERLGDLGGMAGMPGMNFGARSPGRRSDDDIVEGEVVEPDPTSTTNAGAGDTPLIIRGELDDR